MIRTQHPVITLLTPVFLGIAISVLFGVTDAFAQATGFGELQSNMSKDIAVLPRLIATIAYVIATFFAATGLVKLKDWITNPEKNPLNGALFRIVVASLLIVFPHVLVIINSSMFGQGNNGTRSADIDVKVQDLSAFK